VTTSSACSSGESSLSSTGNGFALLGTSSPKTSRSLACSAAHDSARRRSTASKRSANADRFSCRRLQTFSDARHQRRSFFCRQRRNGSAADPGDISSSPAIGCVGLPHLRDSSSDAAAMQACSLLAC
jgi:hypothetical protein